MQNLNLEFYTLEEKSPIGELKRDKNFNLKHKKFLVVTADRKIIPAIFEDWDEDGTGYFRHPSNESRIFDVVMFAEIPE